MSYELVLIPPDYQEHIGKDTLVSHCTMCGQDLSLIDEFVNVAGYPINKMEYEGLFSICPECQTPHLELISGNVDFRGPVLIGWE